MRDNHIYSNGVDGLTGAYALPPLSPSDLAAAICGRGRAGDASGVPPGKSGEALGVARWLKDRYERTDPAAACLALIRDVDASDLAQAGWGVIVADDADPAALDALAPLLALRERQAGGAWPKGRYRVFAGDDGRRTGESAHGFLARHGVGTGAVDPGLGVPYYLLIVGSPERIPYRFQYLLDVQFGVGRLYFDHRDDYAAYARSVVAAETSGLALARRGVFFGVENQGDPATTRALRQLVEPLADWLQGDPARAEQLAAAQRRFASGVATPAPAGWQVERILGQQATRAQLLAMLRAEQTPALLFTSSHGVGFARDPVRAVREQGGLVCAGWSPPRRAAVARLDRELYMTADDVPDNATLHGMIAFLFACHSAGTPRYDDFPDTAGVSRAQLVGASQVSRLPQRLLSHRRGGALAVIGHVDRAWTHSFVGLHNQPQRTPFEDVVRRLSAGEPVGSAMEPVNMRYAETATLLANLVEEARFGRTPPEEQLIRLWTAHGDARNYVVLGDPAVRLAAVA